MFLNLLLNAAQAIPEGHAEQNEIRVPRDATDGGRVVVEIADTGVGIPPAISTRIFDPFFTTKAPGVGMGLGLAICHQHRPRDRRRDHRREQRPDAAARSA